MWSAGPVALPHPPQRKRAPWLALLFGGLSFGSVVTLILHWLYRKAERAVLATLLQGQSPQSQVAALLPPASGSAITASSVVLAEGPHTGPATRKAICGMPAAEFNKLAAQVREHVEQTREATLSLKRTLSEHQRQYHQSAREFQQKLLEATRRKPITGSQRIEISPESLQMLRGLVLPADANGDARPIGASDSAGSVSQQWFARVELALRRLLCSCGSKPEARKGLQTVSLVVHNLVGNPCDERYREVDTTSARFRDAFGSPDSGAADLLQLAGFELRGPCFVYPSGRQLDEAERVHDVLQAALRDCDARWEQAISDELNGGEEPAMSLRPEADAMQQVVPLHAGQQEALSMGRTGPPSVGALGSTASVANGQVLQEHQDISGQLGASAALGSATTTGGGLASGSESAASKVQPWLSSVSQKRLARLPPAGTARGAPPPGGSGCSGAPDESIPGSSGGTQPPLPWASSLGDAGRSRPSSAAAMPAHPAESKSSHSPEPQSGG